MDDNNRDQVLYLLSKLESKIDKLDERLDNVDKTLIKQESNLEEHMKRTEINEKKLDLFEERLLPINEHVNFIKSMGKLGTIISGFITAIGGIVAIYMYFK